MTQTQQQPQAPAGVRRPGAPAWIDLGTDDLPGALAFYGELFGWSFEDQGEEYGHYHLVHAGDALVGGLMSTVGMTCPEGGAIPTQWGVFLATPDAEATLARAEAAGATVTMPAMPVGDRGVTAVLLDPCGAAVGLWQAGTLAGFDLPLTPGTPVWFELMAKDFGAALPFYRDVLDWDVHWTMGDPVGAEAAAAGTEPEWRYVTHGGEGDEAQPAVAGLGDAAGVYAEDAPSAWRIYFGTADLDRDLARIPGLGGRVLDGPVDSPYGRLATIADPAGATFQLIATTAA